MHGHGGPLAAAGPSHRACQRRYRDSEGNCVFEIGACFLGARRGLVFCVFFILPVVQRASAVAVARAALSQLPMLLLMVGLTAAGLWILSLPIAAGGIAMPAAAS